MIAEISSVPAEWLKNALLSIGGAAATAYYLREMFRRRDQNTTKVEPDPLRVESVYPPASVRELRDKYDEHGRRLDKHDQEITSIWNTMREEDKGIRKDVADKFEAISRALGRIEGKIK